MQNCLVLSNTHVPVSGTSSILFPFFSGDKNDSPKTNEISQKTDIFGEKFWKKIFSYFKKNVAKVSLPLTKNDWFYIVLAGTKSTRIENLSRAGKKSTRIENLSRLRP